MLRFTWHELMKSGSVMAIETRLSSNPSYISHLVFRLMGALWVQATCPWESMILIAHGNTVFADEVVLVACDMAQIGIRAVHNQKRMRMQGDLRQGHAAASVPYLCLSQGHAGVSAPRPGRGMQGALRLSQGLGTCHGTCRGLCASARAGHAGGYAPQPRACRGLCTSARGMHGALHLSQGHAALQAWIIAARQLIKRQSLFN